MATKYLFCAGCNAKFRARKYDEGKTYPCPKCGGPLKEREPGRETVAEATIDSGGKARILRGGCFGQDGDSGNCRCAARNWCPPTSRFPDLGVRLALQLNSP